MEKQPTDQRARKLNTRNTVEEETTKDYSINNATLAQNTVDSGNPINYFEAPKDTSSQPLFNNGSNESPRAANGDHHKKQMTIHERYVSNKERGSPKSQTTAAQVEKTGTTSSAWTSNNGGRGTKTDSRPLLNNGKYAKPRTKTAKTRPNRLSNPYSQQERSRGRVNSKQYSSNQQKNKGGLYQPNQRSKIRKGHVGSQRIEKGGSSLVDIANINAESGQDSRDKLYFGNQTIDVGGQDEIIGVDNYIRNQTIQNDEFLHDVNRNSSPPMVTNSHQQYSNVKTKPPMHYKHKNIYPSATIQDGLFIGDQLNTEMNETTKFKNNRQKSIKIKKGFRIFSNGKNNTAMLPSNFRRTSHQNLHGGSLINRDKDLYADMQNSQRTCGPADYNMEQIIGNSHIANADIKVQPSYSFGKTLSHRTIQTQKSIRSSKKLQPRDPNFASLENVSQSPNGTASGNSKMLFYRIREQPIPGVGEYSITETSINVRKKSPKATIGNAPRFERESSLNSFIPNQPSQYVKDASRIMNKPNKLGTIGNEKRWSKNIQFTPGVGDYNINNFKSLGRASESCFGMTVQDMSRTIDYGNQSRSRSKSKNQSRKQASQSQLQLNKLLLQGEEIQRNNSKSRSPRKLKQNTSRMAGQTSYKKLGGPLTMLTDFMNNASREQRRLLYNRETESDMLNSLGPGPAKYNNHPQRAVNKDKYSIPRASRGISLKNEPRYTRGNHGTNSPTRQRKTPISHCAPELHLKIVTKKQPTATIGGYKQRFDVKKMNAVNNSLWKKGILFY